MADEQVGYVRAPRRQSILRRDYAVMNAVTGTPAPEDNSFAAPDDFKGVQATDLAPKGPALKYTVESPVAAGLREAGQQAAYNARTMFTPRYTSMPVAPAPAPASIPAPVAQAKPAPETAQYGYDHSAEKRNLFARMNPRPFGPRTAEQIPSPAKQETDAAVEIGRGDLAPKLAMTNYEGSVSGFNRKGEQTGGPAGLGTRPVEESDIPSTAAGNLFRRDVAGIQDFAGKKANVRGIFNATNGSSMAYQVPESVANQTKPAAPLDEQQRANIISRVGGGGVLSSNDQERATLDRMRTMGAPGSASTRDRQAQAEERRNILSRQQAGESLSRQKELIGVQAEGQRGIEAEKGLSALGVEQARGQSAVDVAQRALESQRLSLADQREERRNQLAMTMQSHEQARQQAFQNKQETAMDKAHETRWQGAMKTLESNPDTAIPMMIAVAREAHVNNSPMADDYNDQLLNVVAIPHVAGMVKPGTDPKMVDAMARAFLRANGDISKLPAEYQKLLKK